MIAMIARSHSSLQLFGQLRCDEARPGLCQRRSEMFEDVCHALGPAREVEVHYGTCNGPAKAGSLGDTVIDLLHRRLAARNHVECLAPHCLLEPTGDEGRDFTV
jgi:hypothetical protein